MLRTVKAKKTILVNGPSSITLLKGKVNAIGAILEYKEKIIVRKGRRLPIEIKEQSQLKIVTGVGGYIDEVEGSTIPEGWEEIVNEIKKISKPRTVMILGNVDSGKTTFSIFLTNALVSTSEIAIIDADIGQSDIGPPTTIGLGMVKKPITDLFTINPEKLRFIGLTTPNSVEDEIIHEINEIHKSVKDAGIETVIINTDGWVMGKEARNFKVSLVERISPDIVIGFKDNNGMEKILEDLKEKGVRAEGIYSSLAVKIRNRDERKSLREQGYKKFLRDAFLRQIPISWVQLENTFLMSNRFNIERMKEYSDILKKQLLYFHEDDENIIFIVKKEDYFNGEETISPELFGKKVRIIGEGEEKGLITGLLNEERVFLGLGIIDKIDYQNQILKIHTPYDGKVNIVRFGQVKIDSQGNEMQLTNTFNCESNI